MFSTKAKYNSPTSTFKKTHSQHTSKKNAHQHLYFGQLFGSAFLALKLRSHGPGICRTWCPFAWTRPCHCDGHTPYGHQRHGATLCRTRQRRQQHSGLAGRCCGRFPGQSRSKASPCREDVSWRFEWCDWGRWRHNMATNWFRALVMHL